MGISEVKTIAMVVRKVFEKIEREEFPNYLFDDLAGYCGRASVQMFLACRRAEIEGVELWDVNDGYHTFNIYGDRIIDITATQFDRSRTRVYTPLVKSVLVYDEYNNACDQSKYYRENWIYKVKYISSQKIRRDNLLVKKALEF